MLCPNCKAWEVAAGATDRFCGWCGSSWLSAECRVSPELIYFSPQADEALAFHLSIHNTGIAPLEVLDITTAPMGCVFFSELTPAPSGKPLLTINADEAQTLSGEFQLAALQKLMASAAPHSETPYSAGALVKAATSVEELADWSEEAAENNSSPREQGLQVRFEILLAGEQSALNCSIAVRLRPEFELLTPALEILAEASADSDTAPCLAHGQIRLRQGAVHVREIISDAPGIKLSLPQEYESLEAAPGEKNGVFDFLVEIDRQLVTQHLRAGRPLSADLKLVCEEPSGVFSPSNAPLQIIPRRHPRLTILETQRNHETARQELQTWALAGRARDFALRLRNDGEDALEIYAIEATGSLECLKRKTLVLPLRLPPQTALRLPFLIDAQEFTANTIIDGALALRYRAAAAESFTAECALRLDVRVPQAYAGVAALDFGAAQSCVAVASFDDDQEARLIKVQNDPFVPTVITYQNVEAGGERAYEIGYAALSAQSGKEAALHVVQDFKQHLGEESSRQVYLTGAQRLVALPYSVVVADYLRGLLREVETRLADTLHRREREGAEADFSCCQLREVLLTCPTSFTFKQKEALRRALEEIGIPDHENTPLLPAPALSASSVLETMVAQWQQEARAGKSAAPQRHLLVYEMGAGATEIALVRVEMNPQPGNTIADSPMLHVSIKILGSEGDEQFGGNNLTSALAKYLAQQALTQLEGKFNTKVVLPLWHRAGQTPSKKLEQIGYLNWKRLRRHAESLKCQFADLSLPARVTLPRLSLQILLAKTFQAAHVERLVISSAMLEKVVSARMELHVRRAQNLLRHAKLQAPDRILLAGKSALLPGVRKHLVGAFAAKGCEVEYVGTQHAALPGKNRAASPSLHDLKAAAAIGGAKYLRRLRSDGALDMKLLHKPMKTAMRIGFGIRQNGNVEFLPIIEKNVMIGTECVAPLFALTWETELPIYATTKTGAFDLDTEAELIGRFALTQFSPALPADLEEEELRRALRCERLRLKLTRHHELHVLLRVRGREHAIYFELD